MNTLAADLQQLADSLGLEEKPALGFVAEANS
jgi:hypothetical protein